MENGYDRGVRDYRLPPSMKSDPRLLDAIHESIVGSDEFAGSLEVAGSTRGQRAVVALQLVDALVGNGGFEAVTDPDLLATARAASDLVGAPEHRSLLESCDTEGWFVLEGLLSDRLRAYVDSHEHEFFVDSDEAEVTAGRIKATFAERDEWLTHAIDDVHPAVSAQKWLVEHFGDRGIYSEVSALLLLPPDDMRQALKVAMDTGYLPRELAFYAELDGLPKWETIESDPLSALDAGTARHGPTWVAVEFRWDVDTPASDSVRCASVREGPDEPWETWVPLRAFAAQLEALSEERLLRSARVRLSTGRVLKARPNRDVPPIGACQAGKRGPEAQRRAEKQEVRTTIRKAMTLRWASVLE